MRIKTILSIAAFSIAFLFSTAFAGLFIDKSAYQPSSPVVVVSRSNTRATSCFKHRNTSAVAAKIFDVLQQVDANGRERSAKLYRINDDYNPPFSGSALAASARFTSDYADKSGSISTDGLPTEFQTAWRAHMKAWRDYADFLDAMKSSSVRNQLGEESFKKLDDAYGTDINRTWYEVWSVARDYGVSIPESNN